MAKKTAELKATRTVLQEPLDVRDWSQTLRRSAEGEVSLTASVSPTLHTLAEAFTERMGFREDVDESAFYARVLRGLLGRPEVLAVARVDEVVLDRRRHAAVLVLTEGGWELATRPFGEGEAQVGVLHGEWSIQRGTDTGDLPDRVQAWADDDGTPLSELGLHAPSPVEPSVEIQLATAELVRPVPDDPQQVLEVFLNAELARHCDAMLKRASLVVWLVRGQAVELWFLRNLKALSLDDLVRSIAQRGAALGGSSETATALALATPTVVEWRDGRTLRAVSVTVEVRGAAQLVQGVAPCVLQGQAFVPMGEVHVSHRELTDGSGWLEVPPERGMTLSPTMLGSVGDA